MVESMLKTLDQSSLGQNMYLKEAASKLVHIGHQSMETIGNLLNVNRASTIGEQGSENINNRIHSDSFTCKCDSKYKVRRSSDINESASISETQSMISQSGAPKSVKIHNQIKATISSENVMQVRIHRLDLEGEFEQVC